MSSVAEIVTEINSHGFGDTPDEEKLFVINDTVWDIDSREPWPYLEKTATLDFDGLNPNPTNIPSDFNKVLWMYDKTNAVSLWPERWQTVRDMFGGTLSTVSDPQIYYFIAGQLRFYPVPQASTGRYNLDYLAKQAKLLITSLESDILLPPRHHRVITLGALWRLYKLEDDPENAQVFQSDYEGRIAQMKDDLFKIQYQRSDHIYVIDEDDEYPFLM